MGDDNKQETAKDTAVKSVAAKPVSAATMTTQQPSIQHQSIDPSDVVLDGESCSGDGSDSSTTEDEVVTASKTLVVSSNHKTTTDFDKEYKYVADVESSSSDDDDDGDDTEDKRITDHAIQTAAQREIEEPAVAKQTDGTRQDVPSAMMDAPQSALTNEHTLVQMDRDFVSETTQLDGEMPLAWNTGAVNHGETSKEDEALISIPCTADIPINSTLLSIDTEQEGECETDKTQDTGAALSVDDDDDGSSTDGSESSSEGKKEAAVCPKRQPQAVFRVDSSYGADVDESDSEEKDEDVIDVPVVPDIAITEDSSSRENGDDETKENAELSNVITYHATTNKDSELGEPMESVQSNNFVHSKDQFDITNQPRPEEETIEDEIVEYVEEEEFSKKKKSSSTLRRKRKSQTRSTKRLLRRRRGRKKKKKKLNSGSNRG